MIPEVNEEFVLMKCKFFVSTQIWPLRNKFDPEGWLSNFETRDRGLALQLLNSFMFFSDDMLDRMFVSAIQGLSRISTTVHASLADRTTEWWRFLDNSVFTYPTGEVPFVGDSGHLFVRRARDLIGIEEDRILSPQQTVDEIKSGNCRNVVFVDDFCGTGNQFLNTWNRHYPTHADSFSELAANGAFNAFYCPVFCTRYSFEGELEGLSPNLVVQPAHWLHNEHSLLVPDSIWWPNSMRSDARGFIEGYSNRIGLPNTGGYDTRDWQGFHKLGLALAFRHCCPDATIPLFDTTEGGWTPLWSR